MGENRYRPNGGCAICVDAAVVKSGSATLEAAVIGTPQVVVYDFPWIGKLEWLLLWMWKRNIPFIAMPNVILQRMGSSGVAWPRLSSRIHRKCRGGVA